MNDFPMEEITLINNFLRNFGQGKLEFLDKHLNFLQSTKGDATAPKTSFGNKLKVFSMIEID